MNTLAEVRFLPGVGDGPEERPGTYEEYLVSLGLKQNTIRAYAALIRRAEKRCQDIGASLLTANSFVLAMLPTTDSHCHRGQLRCALKHWYSWQDRMNAPLRAIRVPPNPRMVCKALPPEEARSLDATARGWWPEGAAVLFGLYLALRREEIAIAQWERFDEPMQLYTVTGKFDKTATLPVHRLLRAELEPRRRTEGYIFPGRKGIREHVHPATIWGWTKKVAASAGVTSRFSTHVLRHTSLTTALDNTENLRGVMAFARHEKPESTAGYTRTTNEQLRRVSDALRF